MGEWLRRLVLALATIVALLAVPAGADVGPSGTPVAVCIARADPADTPAAMLAADARFTCEADQRRQGPGSYWVRADALPRTAATPGAVVRSTSLWQSRSDLWVLTPRGLRHHDGFDGRGAARRLQLGAMFQSSLPGDARVLLWRVRGAENLRGVLTGAHVATADQARATNLRFAALYSAFAGLCVALLVYNIALWVVLRHRFQLVHAAMLLCLLAYSATSSGAFAWAFPDVANNDRLRLNYLLLALSAVAALQFARAFFEPRVFAGWLARATTIVSVGTCAAAIAFAVLAPWRIGVLERLYNAAFIAVLALAVPILWRAWSRRSNHLWLFAIGWGLPIMLAAVRVANTFGIVGTSFWLDNSTLVSLSVEALVSSIAVAYRIRLLADERDAARAAETVQRLLADTDPLTGLLNRRAFLREVVGRPDRPTLIVADIDHFKAINGALGHDGGDEVLRRVAAALTRVAAGHPVARLGGEEFALLLPPDARVTAADVLVAVRAAPMPRDIRVTVSLGVGDGPLADDADWTRLYRAADTALFAAKTAGRDRVREAVALAA